MHIGIFANNTLFSTFSLTFTLLLVEIIVGPILWEWILHKVVEFTQISSNKNVISRKIFRKRLFIGITILLFLRLTNLLGKWKTCMKATCFNVQGNIMSFRAFEA